MAFNDVIEKIGMTIDAARVVVIVTGAAIAFVITAVRLSRRESDVYRRFRQQLGQTILLGLELLVAGDIVRTVAAAPSLTSVAILAAIVFIRTFLSFSLEVEITGQWPWQKREITVLRSRTAPLAMEGLCPAGGRAAGRGADRRRGRAGGPQGRRRRRARPGGTRPGRAEGRGRLADRPPPAPAAA